VGQLVDALCYKPEGRVFDSRWCYWNFSLTSFRPTMSLGLTQPITEMSKKVNVTCNRPPRAYSGSRDIALLVQDLDARRDGWSAPRSGHLYSRERLGTYCTGGWVGPRAGLNVCEKPRPHRDSIPGPSSQ
jgi:hypothetical protein